MSDLVAAFEPIRLAMMVAESTVRPLLERSMESTGSVPLSFMISRGWPSRLPTHVELRCQRLLTLFQKSEHKTTNAKAKDWGKASASAVAYSSSFNEEFV